MRAAIISLLFLCSNTVSAQQFDFSAGGGINFIAKQTDAPINEKAGIGGVAVQLKAIRTGILYYGVSLGIYRLSTAYTMPPPFPANTRHMIYASPAIEANVHLGKRFSFADNALDLGITGGIAVHKADGTTTDETSYVGNYKPVIFGIEAGYTHYFNMIGIGISANPHLSNSIHKNKDLNLIIIPVTVGVHLRI